MKHPSSPRYVRDVLDNSSSRGVEEMKEKRSREYVVKLWESIETRELSTADFFWRVCFEVKTRASRRFCLLVFLTLQWMYLKAQRMIYGGAAD